MKDKYALGEKIEVRVRNNSNVTYVYTFSYAACFHLKFYDYAAQPRPHPARPGEALPPGLFVIPEGTHCDLLSPSELKPGEEVKLLTWEQKECVKDRWGCAEEVPVTPGRYKIVGEFYELRPGHSPGEYFRSSTKPEGSKTVVERSFIIESPLVETAREDLVRRLGVPVAAIKVQSAERISWRDTGLGCPEPDVVYAQVFTPGYRIILTHEGKEYRYHSDWDGPPALCEKTTPLATPTPIIQFGTQSSDSVDAIAVDWLGDVYVVGSTAGTLPGQTNLGGQDVFIRKYGSDGKEIWTSQFGSQEWDFAQDVAADSAGNIYVTGRTYSGGGSSKVFVHKYDSGGRELWTLEFGGRLQVESSAVAVDGTGNLYLVGTTNDALPGQSSLGGFDAFVRKYDSNGKELWTRQFGSQDFDSAAGVAVDGAGNVYVVGWANGALPGQTHLGGSDVFVRKYDSSGTELWTNQFGTPGRDFAQDVAVDGASGVYVIGGSDGALPGQTYLGGQDIFIRKYGSDGKEIWTRQFGSQDFDSAAGVAVDGAGNVYVVGGTADALPGQTYLGGQDIFIRKYGSDGKEIWTSQFGTQNSDYPRGIAVDRADDLYVAGLTYGALPGQSYLGEGDAFLVRMLGSP